PPGEVFAAVTEEAGRLLSAGHAAMSRYDPDGAIRVVAAWSSTGAAVPVGSHFCELSGPLGRHAGRRRADPARYPPAVGGPSPAASGCSPSAVTGSWQDTVVPQPTGLCTENVPPSASIRSFSPSSPEPRAGVAPPIPAS